MSDRTPLPRPPLASIVFAGLALLAPLPLLIFDGSIPLARLFLLSTVSVLLAITEGSAGPVKMIVFLLLAHSVTYLLLLVAAARLSARALRRLPARTALAAVLLVFAIALVIALSTNLYRTPFGVTPTSNLIGALS